MITRLRFSEAIYSRLFSTASMAFSQPKMAVSHKLSANPKQPKVRPAIKHSIMENHWVKCSTRFRRVSVCVEPVSTARDWKSGVAEFRYDSLAIAIPETRQQGQFMNCPYQRVSEANHTPNQQRRKSLGEIFNPRLQKRCPPPRTKRVFGDVKSLGEIFNPLSSRECLCRPGFNRPVSWLRAQRNRVFYQICVLIKTLAKPGFWPPVNSQQSTVNSQQSTKKKMLPSIEGSYSNKAFYCLSKLLD